MRQNEMRDVHGHIEVYDARGNFLFSADTRREAEEELMMLSA